MKTENQKPKAESRKASKQGRMENVVTRQLTVAVLMIGILMVACNRQNPVPVKDIMSRINDREFPSIFQAWSPAENLAEDPLLTAARHDLIFNGAEFFGLEWNNRYHGLADGFLPESIQRARQKRRDLLGLNPNLILILEIRYRDAHRSYLPEGHSWWRKDDRGLIVPGWEEGGFLQLDFSKPEFQEQVARQAHAAVESGIVDGIMLDWWMDDADHLSLIRLVRDRIGPEALILVNANDRTTPETGPFVNGYFMECYRSQTMDDWQRITNTLVWAEKNLRRPRINCLEVWYHNSRADENLMRATTTLSLVLSDGYCLFSDPNPLPTADHLHNWYSFWERKLGKAIAAGVTRPDGLITREFTYGTAAYNPPGNHEVNITFGEYRTSRATGKSARIHSVKAHDGDLFLRENLIQ